MCFNLGPEDIGWDLRDPAFRAEVREQLRLLHLAQSASLSMATHEVVEMEEHHLVLPAPASRRSKELLPEASSATTSQPSSSEETASSVSAKQIGLVVLVFIFLAAIVGGMATSPSPSSNSQNGASQAIARINQLDPHQYANQQDYNTWSPSTCSAAAMTEVINAYGHQYRLADILKVEGGFHEITPADGLLHGASSIAKTVAAFGFSAYALPNPSLDDVVNLASGGGIPVIVSWPPTPGTWWSGGHILVVRGGDSQNVDLVDSSSYNIQPLPRTTFQERWGGFAVVVLPNSSIPSDPGAGYSVTGKPTVSADFINLVLASYHSPATGKGQALYDLGVKYGIDPAFALAFFLHESSFGTAGEAQATKSLGNLRCYTGAPGCVDQDRGGYASYPTWEAGFEAWYQLIHDYYVAKLGKTTIDQIIPTYAPPSDNNNDSAYINSLKHALFTWRSGEVMVA